MWQGEIRLVKHSIETLMLIELFLVLLYEHELKYIQNVKRKQLKDYI